jgi:hypothetical protein
MTMKSVIVLSTLLAAASAFGADEPNVKVEPSHFTGPGQLQEQTERAVIRDYLEAWKTFDAASEANRPEMLDRDFVGSAKDKLASTIQEQKSLEIRALYKDRSHHLQVLFYSPEGLSIELADNVEYDLEIAAKGKPTAVQGMRARYIVVLTPAELHWKVRVFQSQAE